MGRTAVLIMMVAVVAAGVAGCTGTGSPAGSASATSPTEPTGDPQVVSHTGLAGIRFGDARADLARDHGLVQEPGDCAPRLPDHPSASPVFEDDRLVLLWADPPLRTPSGLMVGSPVQEVHDAHPDAEALPTPPERFDGLLSTVDDRAYLFLHDDQQVQKVIVGYDEHARQVLEADFGTC